MYRCYDCLTYFEVPGTDIADYTDEIKTECCPACGSDDILEVDREEDDDETIITE